MNQLPKCIENIIMDYKKDLEDNDKNIHFMVEMMEGDYNLIQKELKSIQEYFNSIEVKLILLEEQINL